MANSCRFYSHFADCVLIYQIKTTAAVHEDSGEMVSVDYWVKHQGSQSSVSNTCQVIPAIKSDRAGRPRVELRGDGLYGAYVSECVIAPPLRHVNRVHCFDL